MGREKIPTTIFRTLSSRDAEKVIALFCGSINSSRGNKLTYCINRKHCCYFFFFANWEKLESLQSWQEIFLTMDGGENGIVKIDVTNKRNCFWRTRLDSTASWSSTISSAVNWVAEVETTSRKKAKKVENNIADIDDGDILAISSRNYCFFRVMEIFLFSEALTAQQERSTNGKTLLKEKPFIST